jgi:hypothetical protein
LWRTVFSPFQPAKAGTMPAGLVLIVLVVGLLLAALLNADATLRKSNAKATDNALGDARHGVAEAVAAVSGVLHTDVPRAGIDEALGRKSGTGGDAESTDSLLAEKQKELTTSPTVADGVPVTEQPGVPDGTLTMRRPTADNPLKLWVGGDSIVGAFGPEMQKAAAATTVFSPTGFSKPASGLTRPDFFNWPEFLVKDVVPNQKPDVMIIMFGGNDSQNMPVGKSGAIKEFTPEWLAEYRKRVGDTMDLLRSPTNDRMIIWCGALIMGPNAGVNGMDQLNYIFWSEAQKRPWVRYFDAWPFFADTAGRYQVNLPNSVGKSVKLRSADNIHLTTDGGARLAWAMMGRMGKELDLSASTGVRSCRHVRRSRHRRLHRDR